MHMEYTIMPIIQNEITLIFYQKVESSLLPSGEREISQTPHSHENESLSKSFETHNYTPEVISHSKMDDILFQIITKHYLIYRLIDIKC